MVVGIDSEKIAEEAAREITTMHYPKYVPYFEAIWEAKSHPERLGKTRGLETVVIQQMITGLFPIIVGVVGAVTRDYIIKRIKKKEETQTLVKALIDKSLSDNPEISKAVAADLYKVLPQILEKYIAKGPSPQNE